MSREQKASHRKRLRRRGPVCFVGAPLRCARASPSSRLLASGPAALATPPHTIFQQPAHSPGSNKTAEDFIRHEESALGETEASRGLFEEPAVSPGRVVFREGRVAGRADELFDRAGGNALGEAPAENQALPRAPFLGHGGLAGDGAPAPPELPDGARQRPHGGAAPP